MVTNKCRQSTYKKRTFNWFFQVDLRVIIMQINRLYLLSVHSCKGGFLWMEAVVMKTLLTLPPLGFFSDFSFWFNSFTVCSTREFSSRQPPTSAALRIWGPSSAFSPFKKICAANTRLPCIWSDIAVCAVRCSAVTRTSRAANMAVHVLWWRYVWKWLTKRKYHL